jgi:hypothetical protein
MPTSLPTLAACRDVETLRAEIRSLCADFGPPSNIEILTMVEAGKRRAVCLMRLETAAQEARMAAKLGIGRFGDDLFVVVELAA